MAKKRGKLTNFRLMDESGDGEYSANPSDYFMMSPDDVFEGRLLVATESKGGWRRDIVVKRNPKKRDLMKLKGFL